MPSSEDIIDDPGKADFVMVEDVPVIVAKNYVRTKSVYTVELRSRFTSTSPNFCQITKVEIS